MKILPNGSKESIILDIGCCGRVNIKRFLELTDNEVYRIDYSQLSVKKSCELNIREIENQRCEIRHEFVSDMSFDIIPLILSTAFETVYFWSDFENDLKEVNLY